MKIKRFQARTMREAMRLVREEQGPDAVILSNHRTADGIEVVAAVDYDAALMQQALRRPPADPVETVEQVTPPPVRPAAPVVASVPPPMAPVFRLSASFTQHAPAVFMAPPAPPAATAPKPARAATLPTPAKAAPAAVTVAASAIPALRAPTPAAAPRGALAALTAMGVETALAREICRELPQDAGEDRARFLPMGLLAKRLPVTKSDEILEGGVVALIGPTGVGKTTTLAKLAARYIQKHGAHGVALVCTDHYRIGAQDQLATYGKLLGVPVHNASDARTLGQVLAHLKGARLVLIDTAGISQRDRKLAEQFITLSSQTRTLRSYLVLAANAQAETLDEAVCKFGALRPAGCILTKLDEATRIGAALSVAMRQNLPIAYTCDGQRVPEDLQPARAERLVIRASQMARQAGPAPATAGDVEGVLHAAG